MSTRCGGSRKSATLPSPRCRGGSVRNCRSLARARTCMANCSKYSATPSSARAIAPGSRSGRIELRKSSVPLATAVAHAMETSRALIDAHGHSLTISLPEEPILLEADPTRLEQIVTNLLDNAAKYTPPKGHIAVMASLEENGVVLRVRDTGVGISSEMLPRVFDLFAQGDPSLAHSQGGLGIG